MNDEGTVLPGSKRFSGSKDQAESVGDQGQRYYSETFVHPFPWLTGLETNIRSQKAVFLCAPARYLRKISYA